MDEKVIPEAFFDAISIGTKLSKYINGFKLEEIHLFSYFSSFLYAYKGNSIADWEHRYIVVNGYPYSEKLELAIQRHVLNGNFVKSNDIYFIVSTRGTEEFNNFKELPTMQERETIIDAACNTTILLPYKQTFQALINEPELSSARDSDDKSWLDQNTFYPKFEKVSRSLGLDDSQLLTPATAWIKYILIEQENE